MVKLSIAWGLLALALALAACGSGSTPLTTSELQSEDTTPGNACTFRAEPTPTPENPTPTSTPTPTPFPAATSVGAAPTPIKPAADVSAYPELPPPALPASVEAWRDAVVRVSVELARGHTRDQLGLVVDPQGSVLTVLSFIEEIASVSVDVPGRGGFPARIERVDPRTGATLLTIEASGLTAAPPETAAVAPGQPVLLLARDQETGELTVTDTFASPSVNAPDDLFALLTRYTPTQQLGTVVVTGEGKPLGLTGARWSWSGSGLGSSGPPPGPDQAAVLLGSALHLLEGDAQNAAVTPAAVAYHGQGWSRNIDGPTVRALLTELVQGVLLDLGEPVDASVITGLRAKPGTVLDLAYAEPQELRSADGTLLGSGRYIVLWWAREGGAPDLVLCGPDSRHLGAAFATHDLDAFVALIEDMHRSGRGLVRAVPLPVPDSMADPGDDQYPFRWSLEPDKPAYLPGDTVTLTFTITNVSRWPVPLDYLAPNLVISPGLGRRDVAVLSHGIEHFTLAPGETASFTMTWDQQDVAGGRAAPGGYVAQVHMANVATDPWLASGPRAELILEETQ